jgi:UDP-N-acetyl-2-amino-2-deoxyglucuronate dehydrogenase
MIVFGLIGCGKIGWRHAGHIHAHPEARLGGIYDINPQKMEELAKVYPDVRCHSSFEEMLNDPELCIVSVCTPNGFHAIQSIEAMRAGKHVLVEKPMSISKSSAEDMVTVSRETGKSLFVVKQNRFNPPVQAVRKWLDQGLSGKIYSVAVNCYWNRHAEYYLESDWKGTLAMDGGTLYTQFSHFIDIVYYLLGDMEILHAEFANVCHSDTIEFEDTGVVTFRLTQYGAPGVMHYTTAAYQQNMEGSITIFAEKAAIKIGGKYLNTIDYQRTAGFDITDLPVSGPSNDYGFYEGSMSNHDKVIHNVVQSLKHHESILTSAADGLKVVEIIEEMYSKGKRQF